MSLREKVLKALKEARNEKVIGKSFNAELVLYPENDVLELLNNLNINLSQVFIVRKLRIESGEGKYKFDDLSIDVFKAEGHTCERCWQVVDQVSDGLCERCRDII